MADEEIELALIIQARDLASRELGKLKSSISGVGDTIKRAFSGTKAAVREAFRGTADLVGDILKGEDLGSSLKQFAGGFIDVGAEAGVNLAAGLGTKLIAAIGGSALIASIGGALAAAGSAIGGLIAAAIPVGMALLPALIVAAIVAAVVFLITHPEVVGKVLEFAGDLVGWIIDGLIALPGLLLDFFGGAWQGVVDAVGPFVGSIVDFFLGIPGQLVNLGANIVSTIVGGLISLPGKVADVVREAFANLKIDVGPFHIRSTGITIDLPDLTGPANKRNGRYNEYVSHHAAGGWAGLNGPELSWLGEREPELVIPKSQLGGLGPSEVHTTVMLDGEVLLKQLDRRMYRNVRRQPSVSGIG